MSSKLHRGGIKNNEILTWEPLPQNGVPVRQSRDSGQHVAHGAPLDIDARLREFEAEKKQECKAAYDRGVAEGTNAGRQQGAAQIQPVIEKLNRMLEELAAVKPRLRHEAEEDIVKLALAIARRILYRELATSPEALLGLVRSALDKLDGREVHRLRVNPQDAVVLQAKFQSTGSVRKIEIVGDPSLQRGSAIFDTAHGALDASVDTQLNEIERGFADLVRRVP